MDKIASNSNSIFAGSAGFSLSGSQFSRNKPKFGFQKFLIFTVGESRAHELASGMAKNQSLQREVAISALVWRESSLMPRTFEETIV